MAPKPASRSQARTGKTTKTGKTPTQPVRGKATPSTTRGKKTPVKPGRAKTSPATGKSQSGTHPKAKTPLSRSPLGSRTHKPIRPGLSLDRKLDITGIVMALVGLLTLLSLLSPVTGSVTGAWSQALALAFGWGMYLFPFGLLGGGLWLVLRSFERIPQIAVERVAGLLLLFFTVLAGLHWFEMLLGGLEAFPLAQTGGGGGYIGATIAGVLNAILGIAGTAIVLAALLVVGTALSFDITIAEMGHKLQETWAGFQDWVLDTIEDLQNRRYAPAEPYLTDWTGDEAAADPASAHETRAGVIAGSPATQPGTSPAMKAGQPGAAGMTASGVRPALPPPPPWVIPPVEEVLDAGSDVAYDDQIDLDRAGIIEETLRSFGAPARVIEINRGPTITQFGVEPDFIESRTGRMRVRVSKITSLADDLALALSARTIRVQAPVPGKGFVGIEVPNEQVSLVALRDILESEALKRMKSPLRFALGLNVAGNAVAADLAAMPHLLIAGATGSGKSVCVNALISCLLLNNTPEDLRMVMVDPKRVELTGYNGIPHLMAPVVVDLEKVTAVLQWVTREMDMRYRKLAEAGARNIQEFNTRAPARGERKLPFLVVIVDELADLMMLAPEETERVITRLAQLARATGIHLVISTQRPSADVVTGLIKANFPARIAFAVASGIDSRVILDSPGAERLLGRGDMLFQAPDAPAAVRLQGVYVSDSEIQRLVSLWQAQAGLGQPGTTATVGIVDAMPSSVPMKQIPMWEDLLPEKKDEDPMLEEAIALSRRQGRASASMLQQRLKVGYTRASRLVETMEQMGIVGPPEPGGGARQILDYGQAAPPVDDI